MIWNIILIFFSLIIVNYILKIIKRQTFFKTHGIPHETAVPIFGNILPVITRKKGLADIVKKLCDTNSNAKYCGFYDFTNPVIILRDHELVKSVLIKNFESFTDHGILGPETSDQLFVRNLFNLKGEKWHDVRNLLSPAFTSSKMKIFYKLISKSTINFVDGYLINDAKGNEMREMKEAFSRYINDVITSCAFGIYINTMKDLKNNFYIIGKEATNFAKFYLKIILMRGFPILMKLLRVKLLNSKINKFFHETIRSTINMRDKMGITRPDILQILMNARGNEMKIDLTPEEITAQAFLIYFAAYDTTTTCLSFMTHELAINPEIQSRLQDEIDSVFHKTNGDPSYDAINELEYLEAVINETTRKYPIFASLDRVCTKQFNLPPAVPGAKSVVVKPGMIIWIPVVGYHYDSNYYKDPELFNPDRFLKNGTASSKSTKFLSFGIGPRQCIGNRFAMLVIKTVCFHLLSRFTIRISSKTIVPLKLSTKSLGFGTRGGYWIKLERREKNRC